MVKKKFIIGEEWLYYKIYCGVKTTDLLLTDVFKPLINKLLSKNKIDQWFFIRYHDSDNHLRLRFHFQKIEHLGSVINSVKETLTPYLNNNSIHTISIDTYKRELSRYGTKTIKQVERLFFNDSLCIVSAITLIESEDLLLLFAMKNTDDLLTNFEFSLAQKLAFAQIQMQYYKEEFHVVKITNKQLSKKFAERKTTIFQFLDNLETLNEYQELNKILTSKTHKDQRTIKQIKPNKIDISSLIHMSINRTFRSKQRLYEMLHYDFLVRYYKAKIAREKYIK